MIASFLSSIPFPLDPASLRGIESLDPFNGLVCVAVGAVADLGEGLALTLSFPPAPTSLPASFAMALPALLPNDDRPIDAPELTVLLLAHPTSSPSPSSSKTTSPPAFPCPSAEAEAVATVGDFHLKLPLTLVGLPVEMLCARTSIPDSLSFATSGSAARALPLPFDMPSKRPGARRGVGAGVVGWDGGGAVFVVADGPGIDEAGVEKSGVTCEGPLDVVLVSVDVVSTPAREISVPGAALVVMASVGVSEACAADLGSGPVSLDRTAC